MQSTFLQRICKHVGLVKDTAVSPSSWCHKTSRNICKRGRKDLSIVRSVDFDEDPNSAPAREEPSTEAPKQQNVRRMKPAGSKQRSQAAPGGGRGRKQERKPTPEELLAMGYDDVDDFEDDGIPYDPMNLREDDPMYTPILSDEQLAEDPPDHKSGYVAVIGRPNAGKSTLINSLVGQKLSIVTYKPQTTRHRIMGIASDKGYQMILFDTPGIIDKKRSKLEERMMQAVVGSIQDSEAIIAVVDAADRPREALRMFQPGPDWNGPPMAVLLNKSDLVDPEKLEELITWYKDNCRAEQVFLGSALNNNGIKDVKEWAVEKLPLGPTLYSKELISEQPQRFFVAELIREKIFLMYSQEIPYATQVQIMDWRERPKPQKIFISAQILVAKESQMNVVIGAGGRAIKRVGEEARKDIEEFLEQPVYLELSAQVAEKWQDSKESLERFGYFDPMLI